MEQVFATADKLSEVIQNMQKCLQCTICLHTISEPVKTRCGHRFCRECVQTLLQNTNATCPLCKSVLHRRTVSKDEHMEMYIDRLEKLVEAIQTDSGIDISLHVSGPRSVCESNLSGPIDYSKHDQQEHAGPSCSNVNKPSFRRRSGSQSNSKSHKAKIKSKKSIDRKDSSKGSDITKYLSNKFVISGVEPLPPGEPVVGLDDSTKRVQSWLETLPEDDALDDPDKVVPLSTEGNLDDTLTYSVSQNREENKIDKFTTDDTAAVKPLNANSESITRDATLRRLSKDSRRESSKDESTNSKRERQKSSESSEMRTKVNPMESNCDDQKPSTSGISRLRDDDRENLAQENAHNQDRLNDIHRTSPCDMLPSMKKNWSSVVQFGKEMRTKRKKLKSLNVSIENKNKSRPHDESTKEGASNSRTIKDTSRRRKGNRANTSESIASADKHRLEERLPNIESALAGEQRMMEEEPSTRNKDDRSMSACVQSARESSFITLEEGEQVRIKNLNSYQMNDIIGVADVVEDEKVVEIENVRDNRAPEGSALSPEKRSGLSKIQDRSESPLETTSAKRTIEGSPVGANDSVHVPADKQASLTEAERMDATEESAFRFQSFVTNQTPGRNRLSLRRRSTDPKSSESPSVDAVSRLLAVKRDLNRQMDQDEEEGDDRGDVVELVSETNGKSGENGRDENRDVKGVPAGSKSPPISNGRASKKKHSKGQDRHLVTFRKLGKVVKHRRKPVIFLYLGSTMRKVARSRNYCAMKLVKPCNPVEVEDNIQKPDTCENNDGGNTKITLNENVVPMQDNEVEDDLFLEEMEDRSEAKREESASDQPGPSTNKATATKRINMYRESTSKQTSPFTNILTSKSEGSDDVLLVSLYDNEEKLPLCVERDECGAKTSITKKTASKDTVKMLSPKKDSQLKFLSLDSPTTGGVKASEIAQQSEITKDNSVKKTNFSDIRGAHSRALIRKSQQAFESPEPSSSSTPKKRKRSSSREKLTHKPKRKSAEGRENNGSDTDSLSSQATYIINPRLYAKEAAVIARMDDSASKRCSTPTSAPSTKHMEVVISSDTDIENMKSLQRQRKAYRKVVPLISSDTDSSDFPLLSCNNNDANIPTTSDQIAASPTTKRKRTVSTDSDETDVNVIVNSWCEDSNSIDRCTKKGKVEPPRVSGPEKRKDAPSKLYKCTSFADSNTPGKVSASQRRHLSELGAATNSKKPSSLSNKRQETLSRDVFDDDSPDFGATIDRIRNIQKSLISPASNNKDSNRQRPMNYSLMQDNFDDIIANVDTEALLDENTPTKESQRIGDSVEHLSRIGGPSEPGRSAACHRSLNKDTVTCMSNSSDKENRYRTAEEIYEFESDDDRTLIEDANVASKSSKTDPLQNDKLLDRLKPHESTSKELKTSMHDTFEQDSLMNITQHYLIIKQFEEDLFGKPSNSNEAEKEKLVKEQRTPQKLKKSNVEGSSLMEKDAEHSGEEDDIVENTPDIKTRSIQQSSLTSKRSSMSSPISSVNRKQLAATPSSSAEKSSSTHATPACKRDIHPLYQSTPKARALAKSNYVAAACTGEKELDLATSANKFSDKQTKGVAGKSVKTVSSQKIRFVCSGLVSSQIENVKELAQTVNAKYVTQFDQEVTHVIVKVNQKDNGANKTLKYLQGVAYRKWIVSYQWVIDSLSQKRLVNEEPYEAVDCRTLEAGPRNSRLRKKGLFEGFVFLCLGPYVDVSVNQYQELLRATGATVVDSLEALAAEKRRLKIIVIQADVYEDEIISWYKKARAVPIVYEWVVECISQYKLISFYRYLQELSRQDVRELGYPEFLFEEDADEDSDSACDVST